MRAEYKRMPKLLAVGEAAVRGSRILTGIFICIGARMRQREKVMIDMPPKIAGYPDYRIEDLCEPAKEALKGESLR